MALNGDCFELRGHGAFGLHSSGTVPFPSREHGAWVRYGLGDAQLGLGASSEFDVDFVDGDVFCGAVGPSG